MLGGKKARGKKKKRVDYETSCTGNKQLQSATGRRCEGLKPDNMKQRAVHVAEHRVGGFVRKKKEKKKAGSTAAGGDGASR